ncbi:hypothetical protein Tco_0736092 [Tanacetum coccineum]
MRRIKCLGKGHDGSSPSEQLRSKNSKMRGHYQKATNGQMRTPPTVKNLTTKVSRHDKLAKDAWNALRGIGAIRVTRTKLRPRNMSPAVVETPNADGSVHNTVNGEEGAQWEFPCNSVTPTVMREFCEKHYEQILPFMAEKAHNEKLKDVRSRLSYSESTER